MNTIVVVGMGPGSVGLLTRAAEDALVRSVEVITRSARHPVLDWLASLRIRVRVVEPGWPPNSPRGTIESAARAVLDAFQDASALVYAVPGNPLTDDPSVRLVAKLARLEGLPFEVIPGLSYLDAAIGALAQSPGWRGAQFVDPGSGSSVTSTDVARVDGASDPFRGVYRMFDPTRPVVVGPIESSPRLRTARQSIQAEFPGEHAVTLVHFPVDGSDPTVETSTVGGLDQIKTASGRSFIYLEPIERLDDLPSFDTLRYIVARLRGPGGCPWDREQTYHSIKKHLLEETYEAIAALDEADLERFAEELGDVLLQIVMYAQFGREAGDFTLDDVVRGVNEKLVRRHPHVFGDLEVSGSADVLRNWERIKRTERKVGASSFGGIPEAAPSLMRADAILSRAERYGLPSPAAVLDSSEDSTATPADCDHLEELGDTLLRLVGEARRLRIDPEEALRLATNRLRDAFDRVLSGHQQPDHEFAALPIAERLAAVRDALATARDNGPTGRRSPEN